MTVAEFYASMPGDQIRARARAEHDPHAVKPWVVLAFERSSRGGFAIVAGYNRYTGETISWIVRNFDDAQYDTSEAVEVTP